MSPIRVAIGEVESAILRDILAQITRLEADIELVGAVSRGNLKADLAARNADVLVCDVPANELPEVCRVLFDDQKPPIVVGLAREGREAAVCVPNAGAGQLMSLIRAAVRGADEEARVVELVRPEPAREAGTVAPYTSTWECLTEQLRALDLALLAEVDAFESTTWEEGVQRLQGLAISPDEVRALLLKGDAGPAPRKAGEFRRRRRRVADAAAERIAATLGRFDAPPFVRLTERFGLNPFEMFCLTAALALEIDRNKYGKAYALLQDDVTRKQPSVELLLRLNDGQLQSDRWESSNAFDTSEPLRRWNLLRFTARESGDPTTAFGRRVELDDRIARYLLGLGDLGPQLEEVASVGEWDAPTLQTEPPQPTRDQLGALVADATSGESATPRLVVHVHGPYGTGRRSLIASACRQRALRLIRVDASRLVALPAAIFDETVLALAREPLLEPAAICLEHVDALLGDSAPAQSLSNVVDRLRTTTPVLFILGHRRWLSETIVRGGASHRIELTLPPATEARRLWATELSADVLDPSTGGTGQAARELAGRFALSPAQIRDAAASARLQARWSGMAAPLTLADLYRGCREQCSQRLATLARQVTTRFTWADLVVPVTQANQLRELEAAVRNTSGVLEDWNFASRLPYGRGITALFSGPSGTGKTMAAGILAKELGLELYQIDLSRVVSKYVGETEKQLERIFEEAQNSNAMLFFDEADALFGKRSAIKDAHDRYANIEVAYLLQKMEEREGVTILATNLRANIDDAFLRRIRFLIEFPTPEQHQRLQIWRGSLPREVRLASDVDLPTLAKRYRLTGGSIVNICLGAASLAYAPGGAIEMKHLLHATKRELQKIGEQYREEDFSSELAIASGGRARSNA